MLRVVEGTVWAISRPFTGLLKGRRVVGVVKTVHWVVARSRAQGKGLRGYQVAGLMVPPLGCCRNQEKERCRRKSNASIACFKFGSLKRNVIKTPYNAVTSNESALQPHSLSKFSPPQWLSTS